MAQTRMFRDRVVSMEQTLEGGEKHLELLKALCNEAIPDFAYTGHVLDHERDLFVMELQAQDGRKKTVAFTRMVLYDAERIPAIVENPSAPVREKLVMVLAGLVVVVVDVLQSVVGIRLGLRVLLGLVRVLVLRIPVLRLLLRRVLRSLPGLLLDGDLRLVLIPLRPSRSPTRSRATWIPSFRSLRARARSKSRGPRVPARTVRDWPPPSNS